jgi:hypothetical protein
LGAWISTLPGTKARLQGLKAPVLPRWVAGLKPALPSQSFMR